MIPYCQYVYLYRVIRRWPTCELSSRNLWTQTRGLRRWYQVETMGSFLKNWSQVVLSNAAHVLWMYKNLVLDNIQQWPGGFDLILHVQHALQLNTIIFDKCDFKYIRIHLMLLKRLLYSNYNLNIEIKREGTLIENKKGKHIYMKIHVKQQALWTVNGFNLFVICREPKCIYCFFFLGGVGA